MVMVRPDQAEDDVVRSTPRAAIRLMRCIGTENDGPGWANTEAAESQLCNMDFSSYASLQLWSTFDPCCDIHSCQTIAVLSVV